MKERSGKNSLKGVKNSFLTHAISNINDQCLVRSLKRKKNICYLPCFILIIIVKTVLLDVTFEKCLSLWKCSHHRSVFDTSPHFTKPIKTYELLNRTPFWFIYPIPFKILNLWVAKWWLFEQLEENNWLENDTLIELTNKLYHLDFLVSYLFLTKM